MESVDALTSFLGYTSQKTGVQFGAALGFSWAVASCLDGIGCVFLVEDNDVLR